MPTIQERHSKTGKRPRYRVMIRRRNAPPLYATFASRREAERWGYLNEERLRKEGVTGSHTVSEMIDRYISSEMPKKMGKVTDRIAQLRYWQLRIGEVPLHEVNHVLVAQCRDELASSNTVRGRRRAPATVNRRLAALSHAFSVAIQDWGWLAQSPMRRVRKLREPRGRVQFLNDQQRDALLDECKKSSYPLLYTIVVVAISTGMRRGEIMNLRWRDLDLARGRAVIHDTKNGERRSASLVGRAHDLLRELSVGKDLEAFVFPSTKRGFEHQPIDFGRPWDTAVKAAGLSDFRFHDLRHTCASYLAMNGASLADIAEVLGHKTLQMVKRYAHLTETHVTEVVARMNARFVS